MFYEWNIEIGKFMVSSKVVYFIYIVEFGYGFWESDYVF